MLLFEEEPHFQIQQLADYPSLILTLAHKDLHKSVLRWTSGCGFRIGSERGCGLTNQLRFVQAKSNRCSTLKRLREEIFLFGFCCLTLTSLNVANMSLKRANICLALSTTPLGGSGRGQQCSHLRGKCKWRHLRRFGNKPQRW